MMPRRKQGQGRELATGEPIVDEKNTSIQPCRPTDRTSALPKEQHGQTSHNKNIDADSPLLSSSCAKQDPSDTLSSDAIRKVPSPHISDHSVNPVETRIVNQVLTVCGKDHPTGKSGHNCIEILQNYGQGVCDTLELPESSKSPVPPISNLPSSYKPSPLIKDSSDEFLTSRNGHEHTVFDKDTQASKMCNLQALNDSNGTVPILVYCSTGLSGPIQTDAKYVTTSSTSISVENGKLKPEFSVGCSMPSREKSPISSDVCNSLHSVHSHLEHFTSLSSSCVLESSCSGSSVVCSQITHSGITSVHTNRPLMSISTEHSNLLGGKVSSSTSVDHGSLRLPYRKLDISGLQTVPSVEETNIKMPSSVYGTQASNIELVLCGLNVCKTSQDTVFSLRTSGSPVSSDSELSSRLPVGKVKTLKSVTTSSENKKSHDFLNLEKKSSSKNNSHLKDGIVTNDNSRSDSETNFNRIERKDGVADISVSGIMKSDCEIASFHPKVPLECSTASKLAKTPKIANPQILEQHISKIISENAAIVETLDPLWSRRYMRHTSISSSHNIETEMRKGNCSLKGRRHSEDISVLSGSSQNFSMTTGTKSKLQSALLGKPDLPCSSESAEGSHHSPSALNVQQDNRSLTSKAINKKIPNGRASVVHPTLQHVNFVPVIDITDNGCSKDGSIVKNVLGLKQPTPSCHGELSATAIDSAMLSEKHPQNPEGSIIKDLLLKNRSSSLVQNSNICNDSNQTGNASTSSNPVVLTRRYGRDESALAAYMCWHCEIAFSNKENLEAHQNYYCKGQKNNLTSKNLSDTENTMLSSSQNGAISTISSGEILIAPAISVNNSSLQLPVMKKLGSVPKHTLDLSVKDHAIGQILKQQLLAPLSGEKSPPLKKRKISEPVISLNKTRFLIAPRAVDDMLEDSFKTRQRTLDALSMSPRRTHSVQMFGGEVQIFDGVETKRMKIETDMSKQAGRDVMMLGNSSPLDPDSLVMLGLKGVEAKSNCPLSAVVVTIAKPVLNSGGTVVQVQSTSVTQKTSVCLPVVSLSSPIMSVECNASEVAKSPRENLDFLLAGNVSGVGSIYPILSTIANKITSTSQCFTSLNNSARDSLDTSSSSPTEVITDFARSEGIALGCNINTESKGNDSEQGDKSSLPPPLKPYKSSFKHSDETVLGFSFPFKRKSLPAIHNSTKFSYDVSLPPIATSNLDILIGSCCNDDKAKPSNSDEESENSLKPNKTVTPVRPTSLPLRKKAITLIGSTLVSPETPRPKKACVQLYINGHAYTYLGLKCSTRSTFCCIYRPQPMFVLQETDPKLSMYSNWQVVPAKDDLFGSSPGKILALYDSRQWRHTCSPTVTVAKKNMPMVFTHSSYWIYRNQGKENSQSKVIEAPKVLPFPESDPESEQEVEESSWMSGTEECSQQSISTWQGSPAAINDLCHDSDDIQEGGCKPNILDKNEENIYDQSEDRPTSAEGLEDSSESVGDSSSQHQPRRVRIFEGGFKSNEDYTYVRGRGRGKYVCEECGIRCKKPSMLKKHIRTHTDLRPYSCRHCSFAFKTKGNLTKHMKSKAHHKRCVELGIVPVPTIIDDSQIDEDALVKQEQLECNRKQFVDGEDDDDEDDDMDDDGEESEYADDDGETDDFEEQLPIDQDKSPEPEKHENGSTAMRPEQFDDASGENRSSVQPTVEEEAARSLLDLSALTEPLTTWKGRTVPFSLATDAKKDVDSDTKGMPESQLYQSPLAQQQIADIVETPACSEESQQSSNTAASVNPSGAAVGDSTEVEKSPTAWVNLPQAQSGHRPRSFSVDLPLLHHKDFEDKVNSIVPLLEMSEEALPQGGPMLSSPDISTRRYSMSAISDCRWSSQSTHNNSCIASMESTVKPSVPHRPLSAASNHSSTGSLEHGELLYGSSLWNEVDEHDQPMDLRTSRHKDLDQMEPRGYPLRTSPQSLWRGNQDITLFRPVVATSVQPLQRDVPFAASPQLEQGHCPIGSPASRSSHSEDGIIAAGLQFEGTSASYLEVPEKFLPNGNAEALQVQKAKTRFSGCEEAQASPDSMDLRALSPITPPTPDILPQFFPSDDMFGVPSHHNEDGSAGHIGHRIRFQTEFLAPNLAFRLGSHSSVNEGKCVCGICNKTFSKPSQLRLHVNIHYFERPFRCDSCAVSFRTKGHLQKHKRSVSHYNKVNMNLTFGTPTTDNPRPFKCGDCKIAFRIHGHLAKHLRSKMHIMKLECLGKLPFGMYAEMERSGVNLNEIDTSDCDNSLESLQVMAQRLYQRDPRRMRWHTPENLGEVEGNKLPLSGPIPGALLPAIPEGAAAAPQTAGPVPIMVSPTRVSQLPKPPDSSSDVKEEPCEVEEVIGSLCSYQEPEIMGQDVTVPSFPLSHVISPTPADSNKRLEEETDSCSSLLQRSCTCHLCGRLFKSVKFLQVHLYCEHQGWSPGPARAGHNSETEGHLLDEEILSPDEPVLIPGKELSCNLCQRQFAAQSSLQQHILTHARPRPYVCEVCDAGFTSSVLLAAHLPTHQQDNTFMCHECGKTFAVAADFQRHLQAHMNDAS